MSLILVKSTVSMTAIILALSLGACATRLNRLEAPYDDLSFERALPEPEAAKPVEVVEVPKPLPLPGQLKPIPSEKARDEKVPPKQAIAKANQAARMEPTRAGYINAVQVYPWTEGALYRLYASPEKVSTIALQPGEELIDVSTGDTVRWVVGDTLSGQGAGRRIHILVKPTLPDLQGEAPPLFLAGADGRPNLINYRVRGTYYIVDRLFAVAELRLGENPQRIVRIIRIDARPVSQIFGIVGGAS